MNLSGAEIITTLLERQGVRTVAGIPGGCNLPIYDALASSGIRHVLARHEQGAGFIAHGMARATGRPAVCLGTSGPGATNLVTAIADAMLDSVPLVAITGQVPRALIGTDAFQEIDTIGITRPITKHAVLVRSAAELLDVVPAAFRIAASGRPGPVVIDVPKDVQLERVDVAALPSPGAAESRPAVPGAAVARIAALLSAAARPLALVGGGAVASGAAGLVRELAERTAMPVAATLLGLGVLPDDHPRWCGMVGMHAARFTNLLLEECDLLLGLGVRFDDRATGKVAAFCPRARIVHVDIDPGELGKITSPAVGLAGDVRDVLAALLPRVPAATRPQWTARVDALRSDHPLLEPGAHDPCQPYGLVRHVARRAGEDAVVTSDVGQHQMWVAQAYPFCRPRQWLTSGGLGTMGFGLPAAIGAALACPDRPVVCFTGDGSLLMNLQELATAAEAGVDVKVVVLDNAHLGMVRQQQELFYGGRCHAVRFRAEPDFVAIARGFGVSACTLGGSDDPEHTLAAALAAPGPVVVHVPIARDANVYPMVPPGAANCDMIDGARDGDA